MQYETTNVKLCSVESEYGSDSNLAPWPELLFVCSICNQLVSWYEKKLLKKKHWSMYIIGDFNLSKLSLI